MKTLRAAIFKQFMAATFCCLGVMIMGASIGWPSPIIIKIRKTGSPANLTDEEINLMISILYAGNVASPIPAGFVMDCIGRKSILLLLSVVPLCGWIFIYFADKPLLFYIARFLFGVWNGVVLTTVPIYIAEIAEARVRGVLSTLIQMAFNIGVIFSYSVGPVVDHFTFSIILASLPLIFFFCFVFMPESPYWLVLKKKRKSAFKSLVWLRCTEKEIVEAELKYIEGSISDDGERKNAFKDLFCNKNYKKALIICFVMTFFQRLTGMAVIMSYLSDALPAEGVGVLTNSQCATVTGLVWFCGIPVASFLIDHWGRKPLLIISSSVCGVVMFVLGLLYLLKDVAYVNSSTKGWVIFICLIIFGFSFYSGLGPITVTLFGEIFPINIKALASAFAVINLAITSFLSILVFLPIVQNVGIYLAYWLGCLVCFLLALFVAFYVVETKGKTLHEIQVDLNATQRRITRFKSH